MIPQAGSMTVHGHLALQLKRGNKQSGVFSALLLEEGKNRMLTHPIWVMLQNSASRRLQLLVTRSGSGLLVLLTQSLDPLIAEERRRQHHN